MPGYVKLDEYVDVHASMYTGGFIAEGGSVVRAILGEPKLRERARVALQKDAEEKKFAYARIDSGETKIQQLQDVFFAVSQRINWAGAVRRWVRRVLSERFAIDEGDLTLNGILRADSRESFIVRRQIEELISERLLRRTGLSGEFRRAIYHLIWSVLEPQSVRSDATPHVIAWLQGRLDRISLVKTASIYRKITKTNSRQMLTSLSRWLRDCGYSGLVVTVDLGAIMTLPKFAIGHRYTRAALIDVYEVLRQFIDAIDEVEGLVLLVMADEAFADDEVRGTVIYRALRMRLSDDVWDARRANALAPMVRISA